ncbi:MAG: ParA family protein [Anaerolineae bacterium]|nr:ParA family protein [Anaerolineae bacterium]
MSDESMPVDKRGRLKVLTVASHKGGVGKTTSVIQIGSGLSLKVTQSSVNAVVLVDGDPQGHVGQYLGIGQASDFADAILSKKPVLECVTKVDGYSRLYALRGDAATARLDRMYVSGDKDLPPLVERLREILAELVELDKHSQGLTLVVIDTGPGYSDVQTAALVVADYILVPTTPDVGGSSGVAMMWRWYEQLRAGNHEVGFGLLPVKFNDDNERHGTILGHLCLQPEIMARRYPAIPFSDELSGALDRGITVWENRKLSRGLVGMRYAQVLQRLAAEIGITLTTKKESRKNE